MRTPTNMGRAPWNEPDLTSLERDRIRAAWAVKMNYRADHYRREVERLDVLIQVEGNRWRSRHTDQQGSGVER